MEDIIKRIYFNQKLLKKISERNEKLINQVLMQYAVGEYIIGNFNVSVTDKDIFIIKR